MYSQQTLKRSCFLKAFSSFLIATFALVSILPPSYAQTALHLPTPGAFIPTTQFYNPVLIKGINIYPDDPLKFDFVIDQGDANLSEQELQAESIKLIKYFMASLTVPEGEMWVNLSPYEKDRIIPDSFGKTEMGRDLLAQDYMLKQLTASLMHPDENLGKEFWNRVYAKSQEKFGTSDIPMNTFNKIWIVPQEAFVYEHEKGAFVVESHLKVMLEEDYLALEVNKNRTDHGLGDVKKEDLNVITGVSADVVREVLIPEIEREVNQGKTFANLRQIYHSNLLATWYKKALKETLLGQVYVDQNKTKGVDTGDQTVNQKIYEQYLEAFKIGVFDFLKEDYDPVTQEVIPHKYFSGGAIAYSRDLVKTDGAMTASRITASIVKPLILTAALGLVGEGASAQAEPFTLAPWNNEFIASKLTNQAGVQQVSFHEDQEGDQALLGDSTPGGIDLNPATLNMKIADDGVGVKIPLSQGLPTVLQNFEGFIPRIIQIQPVVNLPLLLGFVDADETEEEVSLTNL